MKASDKVLPDKAFAIAKNPKYDRYQCGLTWMVYKRFDKKSTSSRTNKSAGTSTLTRKGINFENQKTAEKLHKPIIRKFKNHKVYSFFKDNIWVADLED